MDRVVLIVGAVAIAALVGLIVGRRRPDSPSTPTAHIPGQLDRNDFTRPATPWLVAVFTAETCSTCAGVWEQALPLGGAEVAVQELEAGRRYRKAKWSRTLAQQMAQPIEFGAATHLRPRWNRSNVKNTARFWD